MKSSALAGIIVVIVIIVAAAAYIGTQPAAPSTTTAPTTTTPKTTTTTTTTTAEEPLKVAAIHLHPTIVATEWDISQNLSMLRMKDKYNFTFDFTEGVGVTDGERVGRSYADKDYDIIFLTNWYPDAIKAIADDFPDVVVLGAGGGTELHVLYPPPEDIPPNVGHYDSFMHESAYLAGYLAANVTETNILGIVGQYPVINANRYYNGFIQGAKDANPDVEIKLTWVFTWFDPPKTKEAAIALVEGGADFIFSDATGAWEGANEQGVYYVPAQQDRPAIEFAPDVVIASSNWNLDPALDDVITGVQEGKFEAREYMYGLADGGVTFKLHLPDKVPSDVLSELNVLEKRIINGELVITPVIAAPDEYWGL